jgi:hypothetical protein
MASKQRLAINEYLWIRSGISDRAEIFYPIRNALIERGVKMLTLNGPRDIEGLELIRKAVWNSDAPVMLDVMMPHELRVLKPIFKDRKHFSMGLVDWWASNYWFTKNAEHLTFRNYNGIAVMRKLTSFTSGRRPPLFSIPKFKVPYEVVCCILRAPALAAAPLLEVWKYRQRQLDNIASDKLFYFPFCITEAHVPLRRETPIYDFSNLGSTSGCWLLRDPHASAWLNFANLYHDRQRMIDLILQFENRPYKVYDVRRTKEHLAWEGFCRVVHQSRYAIATGGLHQNSAAKYIEFACFGLPMIGETIPFEFPWLDKCIFPVDTLRVTAKQLETLLKEALQVYPSLRENCLALRETLLKMYNPHTVLDMLQDQLDGKPVPPGYLKAAAKVSLKSN